MNGARLWHPLAPHQPRPARDAAHALERGGVGSGQGRVSSEPSSCREILPAHQDPADRFLAATAQVHDLTLVTDDRYLLGAKGFGKLSNR